MPGEFLLCSVLQCNELTRTKIAAEDIIFQLVPLTSISLLRELVWKNIAPPHLQLWCPAMGNILFSYMAEECP